MNSNSSIRTSWCEKGTFLSGHQGGARFHSFDWRRHFTGLREGKKVYLGVLYRRDTMCEQCISSNSETEVTRVHSTGHELRALHPWLA